MEPVFDSLGAAPLQALPFLLAALRHFNAAYELAGQWEVFLDFGDSNHIYLPSLQACLFWIAQANVQASGLGSSVVLLYPCTQCIKTFLMT